MWRVEILIGAVVFCVGCIWLVRCLDATYQKKSNRDMLRHLREKDEETKL